jgi:hypothetical protein
MEKHLLYNSSGGNIPICALSILFFREYTFLLHLKDVFAE